MELTVTDTLDPFTKTHLRQVLTIETGCAIYGGGKTGKGVSVQQYIAHMISLTLCVYFSLYVHFFYSTVILHVHSIIPFNR